MAPGDAHPALLVEDGQIAQHERLRVGAAAQRRPDPGRQLGRREGLDDVVLGARFERAGDGLVAPVGGDEDDRQVGELGHARHQLDAVGAGEHEVEQHELRLLRGDDARERLVLAGHHRGVARLGERVAEVAQRLGVVVHHEDGRGLAPLGDQADHVIGLPVDEAEELAHLDRAEHPPGAEHRGGRALDGGQRRAQLVAHQPEELRAHAFELLERREVLQGDHHRDHRAVLAADRGRVDQRGDAAPVGDREHDLLGAHRLAAAQRRRQRQLVQRGLAPVGAPERHRLQELLGGAARAAQAVDDPPRLAVERDRGAGPRI